MVDGFFYNNPVLSPNKENRDRQGPVLTGSGSTYIKNLVKNILGDKKKCLSDEETNTMLKKFPTSKDIGRHYNVGYVEWSPYRQDAVDFLLQDGMENILNDNCLGF